MMTPEEYKDFLRQSFEEFLQCRDGPLEPNEPNFSYDNSDITKARWSFEAGQMLEDQLREVANRLNSWRDMLRSWHAWNKILSGKEWELAMDLGQEFTLPLMHTCLLMPSAVRELFTFVGTHTLHQVRLHVEPGYTDFLAGESRYPNSPNDKSPFLDSKPTQRAKDRKADQIKKLAEPIPGAHKFVDCLTQLDNRAYRKTTKNYRNTNSHGIGPRISVGHTLMVIRKVVPRERMEKRNDGFYDPVKVPNENVVRYEFGGVAPLDPEVARIANLGQYRMARRCFEMLTAVLREQASTLPHMGQ